MEVEIPEGYTAAIVVQRGVLRLNDEENVKAVDLALFSTAGDRISISASEESMALLLAGQPIDEPVVGQGPFVMNTQQRKSARPSAITRAGSWAGFPPRPDASH